MVLNEYDIGGVRIFTKLPSEFSALKEHSFRHRFNYDSASFGYYVTAVPGATIKSIFSCIALVLLPS